MARKPKTPKSPKAPASNRRTLVTPEGVDLGVVLASPAARASAFLIDVAILALILFIILLLYGWLGSGGEEEGIQEIFLMLGSFVLRVAWFNLWEMTPRGATPGKRMMKIRVAMRSGGRLTPDAILARNLMRELELFLPLQISLSGILAALGLFGVAGGLAVLAAMVWCGIFIFMPLFNRDRLRAGDLIGGTWVVEAPRPILEPDLAADAAEQAGRFSFTQAQVDAYGVMELQVLEEVIRRYDARIAADVARRIREKIGWTANETDIDFLRAYYAALRRRLEQRLLFGHRRKDKHDRA